MINTKTKGELGRRIEYDVEHDLFHPQNIYSDEYITPTFVEYVQKLEAQIEKMKWHKVAGGDLPKNRRRVYVAYLNGEYFHQETIASYRHKYWVIDGHKTECEIIAWCELPKWEIKEK